MVEKTPIMVLRVENRNPTPFFPIYHNFLIIIRRRLCEKSIKVLRVENRNPTPFFPFYHNFLIIVRRRLCEKSIRVLSREEKPYFRLPNLPKVPIIYVVGFVGNPKC